MVDDNVKVFSILEIVSGLLKQSLRYGDIGNFRKWLNDFLYKEGLREGIRKPDEFLEFISGVLKNTMIEGRDILEQSQKNRMVEILLDIKRERSEVQVHRVLAQLIGRGANLIPEDINEMTIYGEKILRLEGYKPIFKKILQDLRRDEDFLRENPYLAESLSEAISSAISKRGISKTELRALIKQIRSERAAEEAARARRAEEAARVSNTRRYSKFIDFLKGLRSGRRGRRGRPPK